MNDLGWLAGAATRSGELFAARAESKTARRETRKLKREVGRAEILAKRDLVDALRLGGQSRGGNLLYAGTGQAGIPQSRATLG